MRSRISCVLGLLLISVPSSLFALGIRVPDQDARAVARGNAFVATADNPSALYYNPAGITQLEGMNSRLSLYGIYIKDQFRGNGSFDTRDTVGVLPQLYSTYSIKDTPWTVGFGTYTPFGLALAWPDDVPFSVAAKAGRVSFVTATPQVAYKICDALSLGAGPTIHYSQVMLGQGVPFPGTATPIPGAVIKFKGEDFSFGATAGLLWKPHPKHALGMTYRSGTTMDWGGHSTVTGAGPRMRVPASAEFEFPHNVVWGYSFRPTPQWNLEFNLDWTDWSCVKTVVLRQPTPPGNVLLPFNWHPSLMYEWGVTRYLNNGFALSAGYIFSENSVPSLYFNPSVPDSDRHVFSVGIGRKWKRLSWDVAYQFAYGPERTINNPLPAALVNGRYTFFSHALSVSVGYNF